MARRRKGNPVHGWLVINKPVGVTSAQVVAKARWALRAQKAGHSGTLDPLADGVLPVAFGEATKTVSFAQDALKTYRFTMRLGQATSTDDAEGEVIAESAARPADAGISALVEEFIGEIQQVPPRFSAVKVAGERAYDLARKGVEADLAPRPLWVESLRLVARPDPDHAEMELICGKGGYVRAIARDLGAALGCMAHVVALTRVAAGGFTLEKAIDFNRLDAIREGEAAPLLPVSAGLAGLREIAIARREAEDLRLGRAIPCPGLRDGCAWAALGRTPVAIVRAEGGCLHPVRVFVGLDGG